MFISKCLDIIGWNRNVLRLVACVILVNDIDFKFISEIPYELLVQDHDANPDETEGEEIEVHEGIVLVATDGLYSKNTETHSTQIQTNRKIVLTTETRCIYGPVLILQKLFVVMVM